MRPAPRHRRGLLAATAGMCTGLSIAALAADDAPAPPAAPPGTPPAMSAPSAPRLVADESILARIAAADSDFEKDRRAILAMLGEYRVDFRFIETVVLEAGYERRPPQESGGYEAVVLVEDAGRRVVLQHLLVSRDGARVTKHWRQDWHYEAPHRLDYTEAQTWRLRPLDAERTRGAWTQCVYEVSDAPRYCGTGRWNHRYGVATWSSDRSWRPLPRRESTKRSDYDALNVENRHTVVAGGWTHEQDNTKALRDGERTAGMRVREFGFNDYRRVQGFDFGPAYAYWRATADYWAQVRRRWDESIDRGGGVRLETAMDGMGIIRPLFEQAAAVQRGATIDEGRIDEVFARWVNAPPTSPVQAASASDPARKGRDRTD